MIYGVKINYARQFFHKLDEVDPITRVYQFFYYKLDENNTKIFQYFIMHGLGFLSTNTCCTFVICMVIHPQQSFVYYSKYSKFIYISCLLYYSFVLDNRNLRR